MRIDYVANIFIWLKVLINIAIEIDYSPSDPPLTKIRDFMPEIEHV